MEAKESLREALKKELEERFEEKTKEARELFLQTVRQSKKQEVRQELTTVSVNNSLAILYWRATKGPEGAILQASQALNRLETTLLQMSDYPENELSEWKSFKIYLI